MNTEDRILVDTVRREISKRLGDGSMFSLPWEQQVVLIVYATYKYVDNGGFIYFFEGDWDGSPAYSVFADGFRAIGAHETAECIEVAASVFPFSEPHLHGEKRRDYLRKHCMTNGREDSSSLLVKLENRVMDKDDANQALLAQYIRKHLRKIRGA